MGLKIKKSEMTTKIIGVGQGAPVKGPAKGTPYPAKQYQGAAQQKADKILEKMFPPKKHGKG